MARSHKSYLTGFTLIELIITIVVISVFLALLGFSFQNIVNGLGFSNDSINALNLGRLELSITNNLLYSDARMADRYDNTTTNYQGLPYDLQRTVDIINPPDKNLKEVNVYIYPTGTTDLLAGFITYTADVGFGPGSTGGVVNTTEGEASFLVVSGGVISRKLFQNVTLQNTSTDSTIIISGITITYTGRNGIKLNQIDMNGVTRWTGAEGTGAGGTVTINPLTSSFTLAANQTYNQTAHFTFSKNLTSVSSVIFIMSDGSIRPYTP